MQARKVSSLGGSNTRCRRNYICGWRVRFHNCILRRRLLILLGTQAPHQGFLDIVNPTRGLRLSTISIHLAKTLQAQSPGSPPHINPFTGLLTEAYFHRSLPNAPPGHFSLATTPPQPRGTPPGPQLYCLPRLNCHRLPGGGPPRRSIRSHTGRL